jgi:hypothetical protein
MRIKPSGYPAPAHDKQVVEFWRSLIDMLTVQAKLGRETSADGMPGLTLSSTQESRFSLSLFPRFLRISYREAESQEV